MLSDATNLGCSPKVWYGKTRIPVDLVRSSISRGFHPVRCPEYFLFAESRAGQSARISTSSLDLADEEGKDERLLQREPRHLRTRRKE